MLDVVTIAQQLRLFPRPLLLWPQYPSLDLCSPQADDSSALRALQKGPENGRRVKKVEN